MSVHRPTLAPEDQRRARLSPEEKKQLFWFLVAGGSVLIVIVGIVTLVKFIL